MTVLCLVEYDPPASAGSGPGGAADASLRALTLARDLAESAGGEVAAVLFAADDDLPRSVLGELAAYGVATAWAVRAGPGYAPAAWARGLAELAVTCAAAAVVAAATDRGSEVLAHLGAITAQPVAANTVSARFVSPGLCELTRHRWAGSLLEDATLEASLAVLTVAADAVPARPAEKPASAEVQAFSPELADADRRVRAFESAEPSAGVSLATARVVVGGGRGVGGPDGFGVLEELAGLLGGTVGVSRVVTSQGWRPHRQQVGQTGTKIAPELYLACGISGAIQHMAGCQGARHLIAVNTDPDAPIIARADYAVIGDLAQVLPALVAAIRARS
ncbi:MAG TPA: electron transfer flavoprotein subunit alpha/FixB family protein [Streptosporangiaceae bacterium]|nr:electron transfer flavoprotein subunit alpha/FixB family protein [Streptosporangiaceae bacterium]